MVSPAAARVRGCRSAHLAHVDAGRGLALGVSVPQLGYRGDRVEPGVLGQRGRNDLQGVGVGAHAVRLHAAQGAGVLGQAQGQLDLRGAAARDQSPAGTRGGREILRNSVPS